MSDILMPSVSILMCAFNAERYIESSIDSILSQSFSDFELLVVDDGSNDATYQIIESMRDSRIKIFRFNENRGLVEARNYLFMQSTGKYIALQDADDFSDHERIRLQFEFLENNIDVSAVGTGVKYFQSGFDRRRLQLYPSDHDVLVNILSSGRDCFCGASVMYRRSSILDSEFYDPEFSRVGSEDIDLICRVAGGGRVANLSLCLYFYRDNFLGISKSVSEENPIKFYSLDIAVGLFNDGLHRINSVRDERIRWLKRCFLEEYLNDKTRLYQKKVFIAALSGSKFAIIREMRELISAPVPIMKKSRIIFKGGLYLIFGHRLLSAIKNSIR